MRRAFVSGQTGLLRSLSRNGADAEPGAAGFWGQKRFCAKIAAKRRPAVQI